MIDLFDKETNETITVDELTANNLVPTGRYQLPSKLSVKMVGTDGQPFSADDPQAIYTEFKRGSRLLSEPQIEAYKKAEEYDNTYGQSLAGLYGVTKGVFGSSIPAFIASQFGVEDDVIALEELHPKTMVAGEGAGMVGGLMLGVGAIGRLAKGAEVLTGAAKLGEGASLLQKGIKMAEVAAIENAVLYADHAASEVILGKPERTAQELLAGGLASTAIGGAIGFLMPGVGMLAGKGFAALKGSESLQTLKRVAAKNMGFPKDKIDDLIVKRAAKGDPEKIPYLKKVLSNPATRKEAQEGVDLYIDKVTPQIGKSVEEARKAAEQVISEIPKGMPKGILDNLAPHYGLQVKKATKIYDSLQLKPDRLHGFSFDKTLPEGGEFNKKIFQDLFHVYSASPKQPKAIYDFLTDEKVWGTAALRAKHHFDLLDNFRTAEGWRLLKNLHIGPRVGPEGASIDGVKSLLKNSDEISMDKMRAFAGRNRAREDFLRYAKDDLDLPEPVKKSINKALSTQKAMSEAWREGVDNLHGIKIYQEAIRAQNPGIIPRALGHGRYAIPIGIMAGPAYGALAMAGGIASDIISRPGFLLQKIGKIHEAQIRVNSALGKAARNMVSTSQGVIRKAPAVGVSAYQSRTDYERSQEVHKLLDNLAASITSPEQFFDASLQYYKEYDEVAPLTAENLAAQTLRSADFLMMKAQDLGIRNDPRGVKKRISRDQLERFGRYLKTIQQPLQAIEHLAAGKSSREERETLKAFYPDLMENLQELVGMELSKKEGHSLSHQNNKAISHLIDSPFDSANNSDIIRIIQGAHATAGGLPDQGVSQSGRPKQRGSTEQRNDLVQEMTTAQRLGGRLQ